MLSVGLSPRLKDQTIGKTAVYNADNIFNSPIAGAYGANNSFKQRTAQRTIGKHDLVPILMSPSNQIDLGMRNRNSLGAKTQDGLYIGESHEKILNYPRSKKLQQITKDQKSSKAQQEERRNKAMSKYLVAELEKNKLQQELTEKLAAEKIQKHKATLEKIKNQGEERNKTIAEHNIAIKLVMESKPLHMVLQERYQQVESQELSSYKKALEDKRNFVNQDAGSFK